MNKSLVALAVLGVCSSAAFAQSSVTLYGRLDTNVTVQDPGKLARATTNGILGKSVTKLGDGNTNGFGGSRLGFRGVEDLGAGLKAFFLLEASIFPDQGSAGAATTLNPRGNSFFNRGAYLGLSSANLGELRVGRLETLTRENNVRINDVSGESTFNIVENQTSSAATASTVAARPIFQNFGARVDNGVRYTTPLLYGFTASAIVGLSERFRDSTTTGATTTNFEAAEYQGLGLVYVNGPLSANVTYEQLSGGAASGSYNKVATVGASYDFGVVKINSAYQNTTDLGTQLMSTDTVTGGATTFTPFRKGVDHQAWVLGASVPLGNFTFKAQYAGSTIDRVDGLSDLDQSKYGVALFYALSKRTGVYAAVTERGGDETEFFERRNEYVMGLAHTF